MTSLIDSNADQLLMYSNQQRQTVHAIILLTLVDLGMCAILRTMMTTTPISSNMMKPMMALHTTHIWTSLSAVYSTQRNMFQ